MEKEVVFTFGSENKAPFVYHEHKTPISFREMRDLYTECKITGDMHGFEITLPDGTLIKIPFRAIEREHGEHYLPLEEVLREDAPPLRPYGYAIPHLFARYFGLMDAEYGICPCNVSVNDDGATIEIIDIDVKNPECLLLCTEVKHRFITTEESAIYQTVEFGDKNITLIVIPIHKAAEICNMEEEELLELMQDAHSYTQEAEWFIAQFPNR
jgi:hypothetical protein